jgi:hypothetical protein
MAGRVLDTGQYDVTVRTELRSVIQHDLTPLLR